MSWPSGWEWVCLGLSVLAIAWTRIPWHGFLGELRRTGVTARRAETMSRDAMGVAADAHANIRKERTKIRKLRRRVWMLENPSDCKEEKPHGS